MTEITAKSGGEYQAHEGEILSTERKGHLFFGCLCDMRIAVVFTNILNVVFLLIGVLIAGITHKSFEAAFIAFANAFLGLALSILGILGALNYVFWLVMTATIGFSLGTILDIIGSHWVGVAFGLLAVYPLSVLSYQINIGIMSKETYAQEEHIIENDFVKV